MAAGALALPAVFPPVSMAGDAVRGKRLYESRCIACHSVEENRVGPAHKGVFGRRAGMAKGYDYSPAVKASRIVWNEKTLDRWLANPEKLIPGQKMGYSVPEAKDRADLIEYLKKVSGK
ncbi:MAG: c-type cytochrome [Burkholderiales bacterium]